MTDQTPATTDQRPAKTGRGPATPSGENAGGQAEVASYEVARDELASVVARLESGGLSLDESLTLWERGEHLATVCARFLDGARERVETALAKADPPG
ncbi:MAG: exodeoxyribonuclease VII small subunit [Actinomycetota bacterium]|nr:exodeoxyribonuclease VII small subunit [Actinomycetota bacterium]